MKSFTSFIFHFYFLFTFSISSFLCFINLFKIVLLSSQIKELDAGGGKLMLPHNEKNTIEKMPKLEMLIYENSSECIN